MALAQHAKKIPPVTAVSEEIIMQQTVLTLKEKAEFIDTFIATVKVLVDNNTMNDQTENLGVYVPFSPKVGPTKKCSFKQQGLLTVTFNRVDDQTPWNNASIIFDKGNLEKISTQFQLEDFTDLLSLKLDNISKEASKVYGSDGKELQYFYYAYKYTYLPDDKIKVVFRVNIDKFVQEDKYPKNFYMVNIDYDRS